MNEAKLLKPDGSETAIVPKGKSFTLIELYKLLECDTVEVVYLSKNKIMILDEEGKFKKNPVLNKAASLLLYGLPHDYVVGNAIVCDRKMFR